MLRSNFDKATGKELHDPCGTVDLKEHDFWLKNSWQNALFNSEYVFSIVTDLKGVIQVLNPGAARMLGYTSAEVVNQLSIAKIFDLKQVLDRADEIISDINTVNAQAFNLLVSGASQGKEAKYDLSQIRNDETDFSSIGIVVAIRDAENTLIGYLFFGRDNTPYRKLEKAQAKALASSEQQAQRILDTASDAFVAMNSKGEISEWNLQAQRLFGWTREEVIGKSLFETIISPPFRAAHKHGLKHYLATGESPVLNRTFEAICVHRNGRDMVMELRIWIVKTRDGFGFNSFLHDLTERKEIEKRKLNESSLIAKNTELEQSNRMKSEFLATMSHELRTPLNAIIGFSDVLKDGLVGAMKPIQKEYISDIFNSGENLLSLINDILDLSKVEAGKMDLDLEPVSLQLLLTNSLSVVREKAIFQRVKIEIDIFEDLGVSQLDTRKTKQIIYNLLSNAVKFTPDGGLISLRVKRVSRKAVGLLPGPWPVHSFEFLSDDHQEFFEISVTDTGIGITSENLSKLFQAFSQVDSSLSRKFQGTGLGLALVKKLTDLHGGSIAVASKEKEGSQFVVWLPRYEVKL